MACDLEEIPDVTGNQIVSFTAEPLIPLSPGTCDTPCVVLLNNSSSFNIEDFRWAFGNGETATGRDPDGPVFQEYGNYRIQLHAFNTSGDTIGTVAQDINVIDPVAEPTAAFEFTPSTCLAACTISFTNISTNAQSYEWDFGDDTGILATASIDDIQHTYTKPGSYTVSLTAINGAKTDASTQSVPIDIWATDAVISGTGTGKAILQTGPLEYLIIGNTISDGISGSVGTPFSQKVSAATNGAVIAAAIIPITVDRPMHVSDAIQLLDGSIAIIGYASPEDGSPFKTCYLRIDADGAVLTPFSFLPERAELANVNVIATQIVQLPNPDRRLLIIGNLTQNVPSSKDIFYRVFNSSFTSVDNTIAVTDADDDLFAGQIVGTANRWAITYHRIFSGSGQQAELLITDSEGTAIAGYPSALGTGFKTANLLTIDGNRLVMAGITTDNNVYLARGMLTGALSLETRATNFSAFLNRLRALPDSKQYLLVGQQDDKGKLWVFNDNLQAMLTPTGFGDAVLTGLRDGIQSTDCGFALTGFSENNRSLLFVKTDQEGEVP